VDHAGRVRGVEAGGDLPGDGQRLRRAEARAPLEPLGERLTLEKLHGETGPALLGTVAVVMDQLVDAAHVRVGHPPRQVHLSLEPLLRAPVAVAGQELERDGCLQLLVDRLVHLAGAAPGEELDDAVAPAELLAGRQDRPVDVRRRCPRSCGRVGVLSSVARQGQSSPAVSW
jgi:hypothetical protein